MQRCYMAQNNTVYRVGDWVQNIQNGDMCEIIRILKVNDSVVVTYEIKFYKDMRPSKGLQRHASIDHFKRYFIPSKAAQILYKDRA